MGRSVRPLIGQVINNKGELEDCQTELIEGNDGLLGKFIDIADKRFAGTKHDPQGEGYLFEYSERFGISTNLIGLTEKEMKKPYVIHIKVEQFLKSKNII